MAGESLAHHPWPGRHAWVELARGAVTLTALRQGDGARASDWSSLQIHAREPAPPLPHHPCHLP